MVARGSAIPNNFQKFLVLINSCIIQPAQPWVIQLLLNSELIIHNGYN